MRVVACLCSFMLLACGSGVGVAGELDASVAADLGNEDVQLVRSALISAAEGGELALSDGTTLALPPGALAEDADVTLSRQTCEGVYASPVFGSCLYRVEAPEAELLERFSLSLARKPRTAGKLSCPAQLAEDGFRCLVDTEASTRTIKATASAFTLYAAQTVSDGFRDDRCADAPFTACGGDVAGRWTLLLTCGDRAQATGVDFSGPDPYMTCDEHDYYRSFPFSVDGSLSFEEGECEPEAPSGCLGSFSKSSSAEIVKHEVVLQECLETIGEECHPDCTDVDGVCECWWFNSQGGASQGGYWGRAGDNTLMLGSVEQPYCVDGDTLTLQAGSADERYVVIYERG